MSTRTISPQATGSAKVDPREHWRRVHEAGDKNPPVSLPDRRNVGVRR